MKKTLALILAAVMALSLVACAKTPANGGTEAKGSVYYLNFKPEADQAWQDLAKTYTEQTGVEVKVVTAASGQYDTMLTSELDKSAPPTMFQVGNQGAVNSYGDFCYPLDNTDVMKEMTTQDFNLKNANGETVSIGYCYEAYGIIVNKALLKQAGYELSDITNFESLKKVADDIHSRAAELGFDAFSSAGLEGSSSWRFSGHLANMPLFYEFRDDKVTAQPAAIKGTYLDAFKNVWDLYTTDSATTGAALTTATGDASEAEFGQGKAVFFQNGSWEYANLVTSDDKGFKMNPEDLAMIPIYCGVEGEEKAGLCCGTENCWAVNAKASEEDIQATLEFMNWMVTDPEASRMLVDEFAAMPYKQAAESTNGFLADANDYTTNGNYIMPWVTNFQPNVDAYRAALVSAMNQYDADQSDANWELVKTAFVDGWATQYAAANG